MSLLNSYLLLFILFIIHQNIFFFMIKDFIIILGSII